MLTLLVVALILCCYVYCWIQAVASRSLGWRVALYVIALIPSVTHGANHGIGAQTLLTGVLFVALTKLLLILGVREWGD